MSRIKVLPRFFDPYLIQYPSHESKKQNTKQMVTTNSKTIVQKWFYADFFQTISYGFIYGQNGNHHAG